MADKKVKLKEEVKLQVSVQLEDFNWLKAEVSVKNEGTLSRKKLLAQAELLLYETIVLQNNVKKDIETSFSAGGEDAILKTAKKKITKLKQRLAD